MSHVIFLRHGESVYNREARYSGHGDIPLTPQGEEQHARIRQRLLDEPISRIASSDLARCRLLAESIAQEHNCRAEPDRALREVNFGRWEGMTYDEAMAEDRAAMVAFNRDTTHVTPSDGESLATRAEQAQTHLSLLLREQRHQEGALLVVSHSGTLRALICQLLSIPLERYWTLRLDNGSLTVLDTYPMGAIVTVLNDTCHLYTANR